MKIEDIDKDIIILQRYLQLAERLRPLVDANEKVNGCKNIVHDYIGLLKEEIETLNVKRYILERHPSLSGLRPPYDPDKTRKITKYQIILYNILKEQGRTEEEAIAISLNPRLGIFKQLEQVAEIYNLK